MSYDFGAEMNSIKNTEVQASEYITEPQIAVVTVKSIKVETPEGKKPYLDIVFETEDGKKSTNRFYLAIEGDSHFELFVKNNIVSDIPIAYVEGFSDIKNNVQHIFKKCEVIFSANSYWHNDLFKVFCAERVNLGKKLIISEHGGAFGLKYSKFRHEDRISNIHIVWHNILFKNQMRLPPNKI